MSMSVEDKIAMGEEFFHTMALVNHDPEICERVLIGMVGRLVLNGENPGVIWEILPMALAEHYTKQISDAIVEGVKNADNEELKKFEDEYSKIMAVGISSGKKMNPNIVASVTPFRAIIGHAFIEAGKRICNGETES